MAGYHTIEIPKGEFGEISKISEELYELQDAAMQDNKIMTLCELSDLYGAMKGYLEKHFPEISMDDVRIMSQATERAFNDGTRQTRVSK